MEMLLVLFLLISLEKDPSLKESLQNFLGFYRENRELISTILQPGAPAEAPRPAPPKPQAEPKKSPPEERADSLNILEEYLKRCSV